MQRCHYLLQAYTAHSINSGSSSDARTAALLAQMAALRAQSTSLRCHTLQAHASPPLKRCGASHSAAVTRPQQQQHHQQQQQRVTTSSGHYTANSSGINASVVGGADSSASAVRARLETARTKLQLSSAGTA
jgi:hypothetical protein